jgi:hypothetical protein
MRRRNRKVNRHAHVTANTAGVVALILTACAMALVYGVLGMRCTSISQELQEAEKTYRQLVKEGERVAARWNELMAVDRLKENLARNGLEMDMPRADQIVRMNAAGRPVPGQIAVARARERLATANMAQVAPQAQPRKGRLRRNTR